MKAPDGVTLAIKEMLDQAAERRKEQQRINDALRARRTDPMGPPAVADFENGMAVVGWCADFLKTWEADRIWDIIYPDERITLFISRFWLGQPAPDDPKARASFSLSQAGVYRYDESYGDYEGLVWGQVCTAHALAHDLPPVFLRQLRKHLDSGGVWVTIMDELRRRDRP